MFAYIQKIKKMRLKELEAGFFLGAENLLKEKRICCHHHACE
jgi:hypothetical protein